MSQSFSRYEQFLRIFTLLDLLSSARQPLDDAALITAIKERLGLSRLSNRTLHRDCDFLISCGYPLDHSPLPGDRRYGWQLARAAGRQIPFEPLTILEVVAFRVGRECLRAFEGTVLWSGIESLRHKLERQLTPQMLTMLEQERQVFRVDMTDVGRHAARPRLLSTLASAISECREIEILERNEPEQPVLRHRLQPHQLVVRPPTIHLVGYVPDSSDSGPLSLDITCIKKVTLLDSSFTRRDDGADADS